MRIDQQGGAFIEVMFVVSLMALLMLAVDAMTHQTITAIGKVLQWPS